MDRVHDEKANMASLCEASRNGCVSTLTTLIQRDPHILDRVSLTFFSETPLHIVALLGHLEFSRVLVSKKPKLLEEVDSLGRTPLHLASAEGHTKIVLTLLQVNADVCLARDQDERISLHLATMRGRVNIIEELIIAQRVSILMTLNGDSVLHLCVRYNQLDALKWLVESGYCDKLLHSKDHDGNSILHLAVMLTQMKAIKYLLSFPKIKGEANVMNKIGHTALDVLEAYNVYPRDVKWFEIQNILKEAGVRRSTNRNSSLSPTLSGNGVDEAQPSQSRFRGWWECIRSSLVKHLTHEENWIQETRGTLMVVATVIATMAFQAGISPPGGVWQENRTTPMSGFNCTEDKICKAGTSVLSYKPDNHDYQLFLTYNNASFLASVSVILLVISGFPLRNKFFIWLLTLALTISVCFMTLSYIEAINLMTPMDSSGTSKTVLTIFFGIWQGVLGFVGLVHIIRPLSWIVKKLLTIVKKLLEFIRKYSTTGQAENSTNV